MSDHDEQDRQTRELAKLVREPRKIMGLIVERDQLKSESEALRKDAERYQWLRDRSESVHQFYLSVPLWFTGVRFRAQDVDKAIDAMSKGEQS